MATSLSTVSRRSPSWRTKPSAEQAATVVLEQARDPEAARAVAAAVQPVGPAVALRAAQPRRARAPAQAPRPAGPRRQAAQSPRPAERPPRRGRPRAAPLPLAARARPVAT